MQQQRRTHHSLACLPPTADIEAAAPGLCRRKGLVVVGAGVELAHHVEAGAMHGSIVKAAAPPAAGRRVEGLSCHCRWRRRGSWNEHRRVRLRCASRMYLLAKSHHRVHSEHSLQKGLPTNVFTRCRWSSARDCWASMPLQGLMVRP